jgi:FkbM family methyltransferase
MSPSLLLKVRPALFASFAATALGLNRRRLVQCEYAKLFINPISLFGATVLEGEFEPRMRKVLHRYLAPGGVFIDLGANEGYFSVLASKIVGSKGIVVAIEPQSRLQHVIHTNLQANECFNGRVIRCVVSDKAGTARLSLASSTITGSSSLFRPTKYPLRTEEVQSFRLSDLLDRLGLERCDLMKVDIEGAEYDVFMSAADVLKKGLIQNIALEFHPWILERRGLRAVDLHNRMIECGYELDTELGPSVYSFSGKGGFA